MTRLPNILFLLKLVPGDKYGSLEEQIQMLAPAVAERNSVFVVAFTESRVGSVSQYLDKKIPSHQIDLTTFSFRKVRKLLDVIRLNKIDLVHWNFQDPILNPYIWALSLLRPGLRHCMTDHISRPDTSMLPARSRLKVWIATWLMRRYALILCVSDFVRSTYPLGDRAARAVTQYHFINTERFDIDAKTREDVRRQETVGDNIVGVIVSHLIPEKGVAVAIEAASLAPKRLVLWVVGGGPEAENLAALSVAKGLKDRVKFFGQQSEVQRYMQAADFLICPSLWQEAAGLANIKAQACGLPVVASRIGGIPEHVLEHKTGLLFEPGDSTGLARLMTRLVDEPGLLAELAAQARPWVCRQFSAQRRLPELLDRYCTVGVQQ